MRATTCFAPIGCGEAAGKARKEKVKDEMQGRKSGKVKISGVEQLGQFLPRAYIIRV